MADAPWGIVDDKQAEGEISRKRALAQALLEQSMQGQNPTQSAGRYVVPFSPMGGINQLAQALQSRNLGKKADEQERGANAKKQALMEALVGKMAGGDEAVLAAGQLDPQALAKARIQHQFPTNTDGSRPAAIQVYEHWKNLPPEEQAAMLETMRGPRYLDLGDRHVPQPSMAGPSRLPTLPKGVPPQERPSFKGAQAGAEATARAAAETAAEKDKKAPALANLDYLNQQFKEIQAKTSTGGPLGIKGIASRGLDYQNTQRFNNIREQISTELRTIFRIPGEGTLSDREMAQYGLQLPDIKNDPEVNHQIMDDIKTRSANRLSQGGQPVDSNVTDWKDLK